MTFRLRAGASVFSKMVVRYDDYFGVFSIVCIQAAESTEEIGMRESFYESGREKK